MAIFTCTGTLGQFEYDTEVFTYDIHSGLLKFNNGYKGDVTIPSNILNLQEMFKDCDLTGVRLLDCDTSSALGMSDMFYHTKFGEGFKFPSGFTMENCKISVRMFDGSEGSVLMNEDCKVNPDIIANGMFHNSSLLLPTDDEGDPVAIIERLKIKSETSTAVSFVDRYDLMKIYNYTPEQLDAVTNIDALLEMLRR